MAMDPIFCDHIGNTTNQPNCCFPDRQNTPICLANFNNPNKKTFTEGCRNGNCLQDCQDKKLIFSSLVQEDPTEGNGAGPMRRYSTCANVPNLAHYLSQRILEPNISSKVSQYIPEVDNIEALKNVTATVTECLTVTCQRARDSNICYRQCSSVNLLINTTTPNMTGLNQCLHSLCTGGHSSLPYADADVVGIGVFASYIMQCMLVVILWLGYAGFRMRNGHKDTAATKRTCEEVPQRTPTPQQDLFEDAIVQFHKTQCYLSGTIQVASLTYGIFDTDMLVTFLLIPLATNGILPVVMTFVLLLAVNKASLDLTILTVACWILSSLIYWILYSHIIPINSQIKKDERKAFAYQQFVYKLSAIPQCGGYSGLAACPNGFMSDTNKTVSASNKLTFLTPIIWTFSTTFLLVSLVLRRKKWFRPKNLVSQDEVISANGGEESAAFLGDSETDPQKTVSAGADSDVGRVACRNGTNRTSSRKVEQMFSEFKIRPWKYLVYIIGTMGFLAGIGMQLSLLSVSTSLRMVDRKHWSFGQVVAFTIFAPPLFDYVYDVLETRMPKNFRTGQWFQKREVPDGASGGSGA
ncbi:hypothetical protein FB567DRAFT_591202 [Paraphoma chrysanthemicola]|uniref:Uncharacterized protein n=1 Tax=Paraphoma chrysanthemicola TaxID=798071 RepID=A0A8K0R8L2_9PLEO|nr:hypothetical protein FB567DRAFT_591202 [Paraphoma chrysanthemicola]